MGVSQFDSKVLCPPPRAPRGGGAQRSRGLVTNKQRIFTPHLHIQEQNCCVTTPQPIQAVGAG